MSISITDYQSRLDNARAKMRDDVNDLKNSYDEDINELEQNNIDQRKVQRETFLKQKAELEKTNAENNDLYSKKTKETIEERTKEFTDKLAEQREQFEKERGDKNRALDQKLRDLSEAFQKTTTGQEKSKNEIIAQNRKRVDEVLDQNKVDFNKAFKRVKKQAEDSSEKFRAELKTENHNLIRKHENEKAELISDGAVSRQKLENKNQRELEGLREAQNNEIQQLKTHQDAVVTDVIKNKDHENQDLKNNFSRLADEISANADLNQKRLNRQTADVIRQREKEFAKSLNEIQRKTNEAVRGGDKLAQQEDRTRHIVNSYENRLQNMRNDMEERALKSQLDKERLERAQHKNMKDQQASNQKQIESKNQEIRDYQTKVLAKVNEENDQLIEKFKTRLNNEQFQNEQAAIDQRQLNQNALDNQRRQFATTLREVNDRNLQAIERFKESAKEDKKRFIESERTDRFKEREEIKDGFRRIITNKTDSFEKRIDNLETEKDARITRLETQLENLEKKNQKELRQRQIMEDRRRAEDLLSHKRELERKDRQKVKEFVDLKNQFELRLSKAKHQADIQVAKLTERYENMIERERREHKAEMDRKLSEANNNFTRVVEQGRIEKEALKQQFGLKIEKLKQANEVDRETESRRRHEA